jgi:hypothetical protein
MHPKKQLIKSCKAIKQNLLVVESKDATNNDKEKKGRKKRKNKNGAIGHQKSDKRKSTNMFYCSEHGNNMTHATADCYTLKNRNKASAPSSEPRTFSNKAFCKEINHLPKNSSKKKVLEKYSTVLRREQAKLLKQTDKRAARAKTILHTSEDDSDTDESIHVVDMIAKEKAKKPHARHTKKAKEPNPSTLTTKASPSSNAEEEAAYQRKMLWLQENENVLRDEITQNNNQDN